MTVVTVLAAIVVVLPIAAWIGALLWAARRDGRDEEEFRKRHPPSG
jgi:hypothetical protein